MKAAPWIVSGVLAVLLVLARCSGAPENVDLAERAEELLDSIRPVADSLRLEAERRDTVLQVVTDTVRVVVTRERVVQVRVVDSVAAHVDSVGLVYLDSLVASEAAEDVAQDLLLAEALARGEAWREAALAAQAGWDQERIRGDAWREAYESQRTRTWVERGAVGLAVTAVLILR